MRLPTQVASDDAAIAATRAQMSETIQAIEERLSPRRLREQVMEQLDQARGTFRLQAKEEIHELESTVKHSVRAELSEIKQVLTTEFNEAKASLRAATIGKVESMVQNASNAVSETRSTLVTTIRENPIPVALMGLGFMWLLMNGTVTGRRARGQIGGVANDIAVRARAMGGDAAIGVRELAHKTGETSSTVAHNASETVSHLAHSAGDLAQSAGSKVGHLAHDAGEGVTSLAHRAAEGATTLASKTRDGAYLVEQRFEHFLRENPLAAGVAVFAIGAAIGLAVPHSQREDALMGSARDTLVEKAENLAHDAVQTAQESLSQALSAPGNHAQTGSPNTQNGQSEARNQSPSPTA